ncbi:MAG: DUF4340 domain-containing protein, partial [Armatimonadetes bacterium]|nr:DUF4340 domain-containing protein [Armatimonadota bacterium]
MRYRYTVAAALVFVALLVWVLTQERGRVPEKGEVFKLDVSQVTRLEIHPREGKLIALEKRGDQWWITSPFEGWADKDEVERLARTICELKPDRRPNEDPNKKEYGLDNPEVTVKLWYDGGKKIELAVGQETPVGSQRFAKIEGRKGLFLVSSYVKTDLDKKPEDLRDKKLAHFNPDDIESIDLQTSKGTFKLVARKEGDKRVWYLEAPIQTKADHWTVDTIATRPKDVQAKEFATIPKDLSGFGLDRPNAKAVYHLKNGKTVTVLVGKREKQMVKKEYGEGEEQQEIVYVMLEGRPEILLVESSFLDDFDKDLMALRDKHVVQFERDKVRTIKVQRKTGLSFTVAKRADQWFLDAPQPGKAKQTKVDDILWDLED